MLSPTGSRAGQIINHKSVTTVNFINEIPFRIVLAVLLTLFAGIAGYFQDGLKRNKRIAVKHERRETFFFQLNGLVWIPMLLYIFSPWLDFAHLPIPVWSRWLGSIILLFGNVCFFWSHQILGKNWSGILEIRQGHILVTAGPYRFVRHPMYTAILLVGIGVSLLSANWLVTASYLGIFGGIILIRVPSEEKMMLERFGDAYREYMQRTGCLIPRLPL
jgi:protein-S-isoprenylcysteine O-methyltransferase Ste14